MNANPEQLMLIVTYLTKCNRNPYQIFN